MQSLGVKALSAVRSIHFALRIQMNCMYSMYGGHLTITILYVMTPWAILSQTETYLNMKAKA